VAAAGLTLAAGAGLGLPAARAEPSFFDYGPLAEAVAHQHLFADDKTFADAIPRGRPESILAEYRALPAGSDLRTFVGRHFIVPGEPPEAERVVPGQTLSEHIEALWDRLRREPAPQVPGSSLIALSHPYLVPGGRFRELYYWDSYFTMLGLEASGRRDLTQSLAANFADLAARFHLIPNGNRTYYLSRSQPPFLSLMVDLIRAHGGDPAPYQAALRTEYAYWLDQTPGTRHRVSLPDGSTLERYYDRLDSLRPEARLEDEIAAQQAGRPAGAVYRDLRSAAESGWDFSSRWLDDGRTLATIHTTDVVPVDLNCLLWHLESTLGLTQAAERRRIALQRYCWSETAQFFCDYRIGSGQPSPRLSLAGVFPLYFHLASPAQARAVAERLRRSFLQPGGLVTTLESTGQQWDAPNGWAPLEYMAIIGLLNYGQQDLAREIARRWMALNAAVYRRTGKLMEKYNVVDLQLPGGGGEYPGQDGFGWTNGVLAALLQRYPDR
jgi:alpha,alpha-trehalase